VVGARQAYTLFELVLVLALIIVLTGIVYPSLDAMYGDYRVTQAADMIRAAWANARAQALDQGRAYRFAILPGMGNFRIAPDSAEFWGGQGEAFDPLEATDLPYLVEETLPRGVRFATVATVQSGELATGGESFMPPGTLDPSAWTTTATFLPDGTARDDVEIVFQARRALPVVLRLRALTGVVTVKSLRSELGK
jgi:hypothetical protein